MALNIGNGVVQNGLILNLDAANIRSYPGYGTNFYNLVDNSATSLVNGTTFLSNNLGNFIFDGSGNYINIPYQLVPDNGSFTISFWVKFISIPSTYIPLVDSGNFGGGGNGYCIAIDNNSKLYLAIKSGFVSIVDTLYTNVWYHITGTANYGTPYDIKLYINGILGIVNTSATINSLSGSNANIKIGSNFVSTLKYANINLGQIQFYNRVLSASEVQQNYNATKNRYITDISNEEAGLVKYFDFGNNNCYSGLGFSVFNLSSPSYSGNLINGPKFEGDFGGGIRFDGVDDSIDFTGANNTIFYNNFTHIVVCKPTLSYTLTAESNTGTSASSADKPFVVEPFNPFDASVAGSGLAVGTNGIEVVEHSTGLFTALCSYPVQLSGVNHVAYRYVNGRPQIFLNGVLVKTGVQSSKSYSIMKYTQSLGYGYYGQFQGTLYSYKAYNKTLTSTEIYDDFIRSAGKYNISPTKDSSLVLDLDLSNRSVYPGFGTTTYNLAGVAFTGSLTGSTFSYSNQGFLSFNGSSDVLSFNDAGSGVTFNSTVNYNVSGWVYANSTQVRPNPSIVEKYNGTGGYPIAIRWSQNGIVAAVYDGTNNPGIGFTVGANKWCHFSANFLLPQKRIDLYINGKLATLTNYSTLNNISSSASIKVGYRGFDSNTYFTGSVADVKIYNRGLSSNEISLLYDNSKSRFYSNTNDIRENLFLDYDANNIDSYPGGSTWYDVSGTGSTARMVGNNYFIRDRVNSSFSLNGSDAYFTSGIVTGLDTYQLPITYFGWIKMNSTIGNQSVFGYYLNTSAIYNYLRMDTGTFRFFLSIDGVLYPGINSGQYQYYDYSTSFSTNTWYNFAIVVGGTLTAPTLTMYINNKAQTFSPVNLKSSVTANIDFRIGANQQNAQFLNGYISQFRVYKRALTADEINVLFQNTRSRYGI